MALLKQTTASKSKSENEMINQIQINQIKSELENIKAQMKESQLALSSKLESWEIKEYSEVLRSAMKSFEHKSSALDFLVAQG